MKFGRGRALGRALGLALAASLRETQPPGTPAVDALVPVPLSAQRLLERGYNQAIEIAHALSVELRLPIMLSGVLRPVGRGAQSRLGARARKVNVAQAFRVHRRLSGLRVAIVDDVITTGATLDALAAELETAGAVRIEAIAVARTIVPGQSPEPTPAVGKSPNT